MAGTARERILRETLRLIGEQGIGAVSNRAVAAAAGVSLGSLTYHFPSQSDLLRECLRTFVDAEIARVTELAERLRPQFGDLDQVAAEVERAIAGFAQGPEQIANLELHLHAGRDHAVRETSARAVAAYDGLATAILTALGVPEPATHAPTVVALTYGLAVRRLATGDRTATGTADAFRLLLTGALNAQERQRPARAAQERG